MGLACGGATVYFDNFETATGWATNPDGTDTATTGQWERGDPAATTSSGTKQLGTKRCRKQAYTRTAARYTSLFTTSMEPKAVKIGWVEVPSSSARVLALRPSMPFERTTRSAASVISSFVNLFFGAIARTLSFQKYILIYNA